MYVFGSNCISIRQEVTKEIIKVKKSRLVVVRVFFFFFTMLCLRFIQNINFISLYIHIIYILLVLLLSYNSILRFNTYYVAKI